MYGPTVIILLSLLHFSHASSTGPASCIWPGGCMSRSEGRGGFVLTTSAQALQGETIDISLTRTTGEWRGFMVQCTNSSPTVVRPENADDMPTADSDTPAVAGGKFVVGTLTSVDTDIVGNVAACPDASAGVLGHIGEAGAAPTFSDSQHLTFQYTTPPDMEVNSVIYCYAIGVTDELTWYGAGTNAEGAALTDGYIMSTISVVAPVSWSILIEVGCGILQFAAAEARAQILAAAQNFATQQTAELRIVGEDIQFVKDGTEECQAGEMERHHVQLNNLTPAERDVMFNELQLGAQSQFVADIKTLVGAIVSAECGTDYFWDSVSSICAACVTGETREIGADVFACSSIDLCIGLVCGSNANCVEGTCQCDDGFTGDATTACTDSGGGAASCTTYGGVVHNSETTWDHLCDTCLCSDGAITCTSICASNTNSVQSCVDSNQTPSFDECGCLICVDCNNLPAADAISDTHRVTNRVCISTTDTEVEDITPLGLAARRCARPVGQRNREYITGVSECGTSTGYFLVPGCTVTADRTLIIQTIMAYLGDHPLLIPEIYTNTPDCAELVIKIYGIPDRIVATIISRRVPVELGALGVITITSEKVQWDPYLNQENPVSYCPPCYDPYCLNNYNLSPITDLAISSQLTVNNECQARKYLAFDYSERWSVAWKGQCECPTNGCVVTDVDRVCGIELQAETVQTRQFLSHCWLQHEQCNGRTPWIAVHEGACVPPGYGVLALEKCGCLFGGEKCNCNGVCEENEDENNLNCGDCMDFQCEDGQANGVCDTDENTFTCFADCYAGQSCEQATAPQSSQCIVENDAVCGTRSVACNEDGQCDNGETDESCAGDCSCIQEGICTIGTETPTSCPEDCNADRCINDNLCLTGLGEDSSCTDCSKCDLDGVTDQVDESLGTRESCPTDSTPFTIVSMQLELKCPQSVIDSGDCPETCLLFVTDDGRLAAINAFQEALIAEAFPGETGGNPRLAILLPLEGKTCTVKQAVTGERTFIVRFDVHVDMNDQAVGDQNDVFYVIQQLVSPTILQALTTNPEQIIVDAVAVVDETLLTWKGQREVTFSDGDLIDAEPTDLFRNFPRRHDADRDAEPVPLLESVFGVKNVYIIGMKRFVSQQNVISFYSTLLTAQNSEGLPTDATILNAHNGLDRLTRRVMIRATLNAAILLKIRQLREVSLIEQDGVINAFGGVFTVQTLGENENMWYLSRIDQRERFNPTITPYNYTYFVDGEHTFTYILDTGIDKQHTEFAGGMRVQSGWSYDGSSSTDDENGHGTAVASIVGGTTLGVAKKTNLVSVKVLNEYGHGLTSDALGGLLWTMKNTRVRAPGFNRNQRSICLVPFGSHSGSLLMNDLMADMQRLGVTFIFAAGNGNANACDLSPQNFKNPTVPETNFGITVGANNVNDQKASFSNHGPCVDLFAPGEEIQVAVNTGAMDSTSVYGVAEGTSLAAAIAAGYAAKILQAHPVLSPQQVKEFMKARTTVADRIFAKVSVQTDTFTDVQVASVCGDGTKDAAEECDDNGNAIGDGCDNHCHIEAGYTCPNGLNCVLDTTAVCGQCNVDSPCSLYGSGGCLRPRLEGTRCPMNTVECGTCGDNVLNAGEQCESTEPWCTNCQITSATNVICQTSATLTCVEITTDSTTIVVDAASILAVQDGFEVTVNIESGSGYVKCGVVHDICPAEVNQITQLKDGVSDWTLIEPPNTTVFITGNPMPGQGQYIVCMHAKSTGNEVITTADRSAYVVGHSNAIQSVDVTHIKGEDVTLQVVIESGGPATVVCVLREDDLLQNDDIEAIAENSASTQLKKCNPLTGCFFMFDQLEKNVMYNAVCSSGESTKSIKFLGAAECNDLPSLGNACGLPRVAFDSCTVFSCEYTCHVDGTFSEHCPTTPVTIEACTSLTLELNSNSIWSSLCITPSRAIEGAICRASCTEGYTPSDRTNEAAIAECDPDVGWIFTKNAVTCDEQAAACSTLGNEWDCPSGFGVDAACTLVCGGDQTSSSPNSAVCTATNESTDPPQWVNLDQECVSVNVCQALAQSGERTGTWGATAEECGSVPVGDTCTLVCPNNQVADGDGQAECTSAGGVRVWVDAAQTCVVAQSVDITTRVGGDCNNQPDLDVLETAMGNAVQVDKSNVFATADNCADGNWEIGFLISGLNPTKASSIINNMQNPTSTSRAQFQNTIANSEVTTAVASSSTQTCAAISTTVLNGNWANNGCGGQTVGSTCTLTCHEGFTGGGTATCLQDGQFSTPALTCTASGGGSRCARIQPVNITGGQWSSNGCPSTVPQGTCQLICSTGYEVPGGNSTATCNNNGNWVGADKTCAKKRCTAISPSQISNGNWANSGCDNAQFESTCELICAADYAPEGDGEATCSANGSFVDTSQTCGVEYRLSSTVAVRDTTATTQTAVRTAYATYFQRPTANVNVASSSTTSSKDNNRSKWNTLQASQLLVTVADITKAKADKYIAAVANSVPVLLANAGVTNVVSTDVVLPQGGAPSAPPAAPSGRGITPSSSEDDGGSNASPIIGIILGCLGGIILLVAAIFFFLKTKKRKQDNTMMSPQQVANHLADPNFRGERATPDSSIQSQIRDSMKGQTFSVPLNPSPAGAEGESPTSDDIPIANIGASDVSVDMQSEAERIRSKLGDSPEHM